jgi:predicted Zn-dependent protease
MLRYLKAVARGLAYPARAARRWPWLTLALASLVLAGTALAGNWYVWHQWEAAQTALAEGRPGEARARLDVCLFLWPRDPEVHLLAARAARLTGDARAAESHLNRARRLSGGATQALQLEFLLLRVQTGEVEEVAPTLFECVDKGHAESPLILETLASAYLHRHRYKPAYYCLERWIALRPGAPKPHQWMGWLLERWNRPKLAAEEYRRALALDPDLIPVRLRVAEMLLEDKRAPEAVPHLEQLYRQAPDNPQVQARLGMCRFYQNQMAEARRLMEAALPHLPRDLALLIHLGMLDLQQGRAVAAERHLRQALEVDPSDTEALHNLASALQIQGRTAEAETTLQKHAWYKERLDRANEMLKEVADSSTAKAADYAELGRLLLEIGRERLGVYWLEQALERDPGHQPTHKLLAEHFAKKGDRERAEIHRRQLREAVVKRDSGAQGQRDKETRRQGDKETKKSGQ